MKRTGMSMFSKSRGTTSRPRHLPQIIIIIIAIIIIIKIIIIIIIAIVFYLTLVRMQINDKTNYKSHNLQLGLFTKRVKHVLTFNI